MIIDNAKTKKPSTVSDIFEYLMKTPRSWTFFSFKIILFAKFTIHSRQCLIANHLLSENTLLRVVLSTFLSVF